MFTSFKRERLVREALKGIAGQRAVGYLEPGNLLNVEGAPPQEEWFDLAVQTALIRGWVAVLYDAMPGAVVGQTAGAFSPPPKYTKQTTYRLTEGGWAALHRSHGWTVWTFWVALFALLGTLWQIVGPL